MSTSSMYFVIYFVACFLFYQGQGRSKTYPTNYKNVVTIALYIAIYYTALKEKHNKTFKRKKETMTGQTKQ